MDISDDLGLPSLQKLQSAEQEELLDVVDSLRACGLSEIVALPQLIVCGDQSSGKSSVLEAISGIPFPKHDTLCTRFATEVILRRGPNVEIKVSIVPGEERSGQSRDRLLQFRCELKSNEDFGDLFKNARDAMGLSSPGNSFSNDVLRIEFCGPTQPQLTLVDLPGLIHSETSSQTTADVQLVHNLVSRYLENPRSIILAVVSAKNDISNQIILRKARNVDAAGLRTLGIITKPDLVVRGSRTEAAFISLARNEDVKFALGWHTVKNLDSADSRQQNADTRDQQEALFFKESGFSCLPAHTTGIKFLRTLLSKILFSQIQRELPRLIEEIHTQIAAVRLAREKLGPSRSMMEEQREFLISLSQTFQNICRDGVKGDYDHVFFQDDDDPERKLCANVMNMHFDFATKIRKNGASWLIDHNNVFDGRYRTRHQAIKDACILLKRSRGRELPGLPNYYLVGELFRQYSRPWGDHARAHIKRVLEATNRFLELLLEHLTDNEVCGSIFRFWLQPIMEEKLSLAYSKLDELLEVHKDYPMTTNSQFVTNSKSSRQDDNRKELDASLRSHLQSKRDISVDEISQLISTLTAKADEDMDMIAAEEALDNMNAYYDIALDLFTDNVPNLAIQSPIIRQVPNIFSPTAVYSMDKEVVQRIAGETEEKVLEREAVLRRLSTLEKGASICKQYTIRPQSLERSLLSRNEINHAQGASKSTATIQKPLSEHVSSHNIFSHVSDTTSDEDEKDASLKRRVTDSRRIKGTRASPKISSSKSSHTRGIIVDGGRSPATTGALAVNLPDTSSPGHSGIDKKPSVRSLFPEPQLATTNEVNHQSSISNKENTSGFSLNDQPKFSWSGNVKSDSSSIFPFGAPSKSLFGDTLSKESTGSKPEIRGLFGGYRPASAVDYKKRLNEPFTTAINSPTPTSWIPFNGLLQPDSSSLGSMMECYQHICSMPEFKRFSCEELRLNDYEYEASLK